MSNYSKKYQKYKLKYINLKKQQKMLKGGADYSFKSKFGSQGSANGQFEDPQAIAVLANGDIAVSDTDNHRVQIFNSNGEFKSKFGSQGSGDGQFEYLQAITVFANGDFAICDSINNHVQIFNSDGEFKSKFGSQGSGDGQFDFPTGIAVFANGDIAVCDSDNNRVQIFNSNGVFKSKFGSQGSGDGQFQGPNGIAVFANDDIAICDTVNHRVQIFNSDGVFKSKFGSRGSGDGKFQGPNGIAVFANDDIAICDTVNHRVQIFNSDGSFKSKFGSTGRDDGKFKYPSRIAVFANGDIAVCDYGNNRVQIFGLDVNVSSNLMSQFDNAGDNIDEITPINIQEVLTNINYTTQYAQKSIEIPYLEIGTKKIFDFDEYKEFTDPDNPTNSVKILLKKHNLFETLYQYKNILLTPNSKLFFIFSNIATSQRDKGIDAGGLTRTVFTYLSKSLSKSIFFIEDHETKLFRLKTFTDVELDQNENRNKLYFIGQLFGLIIKLNLTLQINLEPILLYQLTHDIDLSNINKELILSIISDYDNEMLENMPYMCFDVNPDTLITPKIQIGCLYNSDGEPLIDITKLETSDNKIFNIEEINKVKNEIVKRIIEEIKERHKVTKIFVDGFRSQINIKKSKINRLPLNLLNDLISGIIVKDYQTFLKHLKFVNFTHTQQIQLEEILKNQICTNVQSKYIGLLLMVMTGTNSIPANGYPNYYPLRFEITNVLYDKPVDIHNCFNQFIINTKIFNDYATAIDSKLNKKQTELYNVFNLESLEELKDSFTNA